MTIHVSEAHHLTVPNAMQANGIHVSVALCVSVGF
jgi:hypothetical protein